GHGPLRALRAGATGRGRCGRQRGHRPHHRRQRQRTTRSPSGMSDTRSEAAPRRGWLARLRDGLSRSSSKLATGIAGIFTKRRLDEAALQELEELLIAGDLGPATAAKLTAGLAKTRFDQEIAPEEVRAVLAQEI